MTSHSDSSPSVLNAEICAGVKRLGFGTSQVVRLYGEEFEVVSDPFPDAGGVAINVKIKKTNHVRVLQLPQTILQSIKGSLSGIQNRNKSLSGAA